MNRAERDAINPFLIQTTVGFKRMTTPFLIVYVIHQNCHLQPLRAGRFISTASSGLCHSSHFCFLQKCHHFINLARHEIREAVHQSALPTERTEPCMAPLRTHRHTHSPQTIRRADKAFCVPNCHSQLLFFL